MSAIYQLSESLRNQPPAIQQSRVVPANLDAMVERIGTSLTLQEAIEHLRTNPVGDAIRLKLIAKLNAHNRYGEALELALELQDIRDRDIQLNALIAPLVKEDAAPRLNRLVNALTLEKKNAAKFRIGVNYADRQNFVRVVDTYFFIDRMPWRHNLFLATFHRVPDDQKVAFFDAIITTYLSRDEVEYAIQAVKKCPNVDRQVAFTTIARALIKHNLLTHVALVINEIAPENRLRIQPG